MTAVHLRCPGCNAHVTPGADWCTLCYADLRTPEPGAPEAVAPEPTPLAAATTRAYDEPVHGYQPYGEQVAAAGTEDERQAAAAAAAEQMLAQLAAESDVPLRGIAGSFESSAAKVGLIAGGCVVVVIVLFALLSVIGSLL